MLYKRWNFSLMERKVKFLCVCVMMFFWKCFASERDAGSPNWSGSDDAFIGLSGKFTKNTHYSTFFLCISEVLICNIWIIMKREGAGSGGVSHIPPTPCSKFFDYEVWMRIYLLIPNFLTNTKALWSPNKNLEFLEWQIFSKAKTFVFDLIMCNVLV